ncbi:MAG: N-acetyl sugar amidotransferase [Lentisphaerae bacterium]|jgi:N-acetyl sugar amidotransferase|nr:N-acetyl sugar amidotransferase [Lentisphaerota bacterium]MBT4814826.1 N-acetyl sugar amidotransferase [Lentisphaerota bacterium]MBT5604967.1 N-acetyl sugar amidotransferase [Lentisphaerota bacterium]MBT7055965.1 N-acetyl sugar amidotransferase [Lentisphaerota bacterium]MBT7844628.1 N-acetyl sugar amidotransferase [Lentisphaerota bacterium]
MSDERFGKYGLPLKVEYCNCCTISNQRPSSAVEFQQKSSDKKEFVSFEDGICDACKFLEFKRTIDWGSREEELVELCDRYRRDDGRHDVVVPGSGGRDSVMAAHLLKYKYGMHPILITWPPILPTNIGRRNYDAWVKIASCYAFQQNKELHSTLTRLAFERLGHPFQPFILGQKNLAPKLSILLGIPLVIYGEHEAEYGNNRHEAMSPIRDRKYYSTEVAHRKLVLGGTAVDELMDEYGFTMADLQAYLPPRPDALDQVGTTVHYLGYYVKWHPQEVYYYAVENTDFLPNDHRTEGCYGKYFSIDDKIDWLHYYTYHIKFGMGRATHTAAQEIRNGDIRRDEGVALIKRFDGEYPEQYLDDCCQYMGITREHFDEVIEGYRTPHLWRKDGSGNWVLKHPIWESAPGKGGPANA